MDTPSFVKDCMQKTIVRKYTKRMFHNYLPYNITAVQRKYLRHDLN